MHARRIENICHVIKQLQPGEWNKMTDGGKRLRVAHVISFGVISIWRGCLHYRQQSFFMQYPVKPTITKHTSHWRHTCCGDVSPLTRFSFTGACALSPACIFNFSTCPVWNITRSKIQSWTDGGGVCCVFVANLSSTNKSNSLIDVNVCMGAFTHYVSTRADQGGSICLRGDVLLLRWQRNQFC